MLKTKEEIWKPVRGYEDLYEVSSLGKIRKAKTGKILKPINTRTDYKAIYLTKNYEKEYKLMHRLIGETFSSSTINECIDHINGVKDDNRADNLKWCSCIENSNNPLTIGRKKKPKTKHNRIVSTDQNGSEKNIWVGKGGRIRCERRSGRHILCALWQVQDIQGKNLER